MATQGAPAQQQCSKALFLLMCTPWVICVRPRASTSFLHGWTNEVCLLLRYVPPTALGDLFLFMFAHRQCSSSLQP
eukprot:1146042-Pelagomonas_calceolata.AAC.7